MPRSNGARSSFKSSRSSLSYIGAGRTSCVYVEPLNFGHSITPLTGCGGPRDSAYYHAQAGSAHFVSTRNFCGLCGPGAFQARSHGIRRLAALMRVGPAHALRLNPLFQTLLESLDILQESLGILQPSFHIIQRLVLLIIRKRLVLPIILQQSRGFLQQSLALLQFRNRLASASSFGVGSWLSLDTQKYLTEGS